MSTENISDQALVQAVNDAYSARAQRGADSEYSNTVAKAFGYTIEQLESIPKESHMGLSCGNPVAGATIKPGERVLDLGSGGGIDVLLAAAKVGPEGRAIGLDISPDMISLARANARKKSLFPPQVSFVQTSLTDPLPIQSDSIDCILSNCVINLLPTSGKAQVLKEAYRVLKPGGRIVLDDILAKKPIPESISKDLGLHCSCIVGALEIGPYKAFLEEAGFKDAVFVDTQADLSIYSTATSTGSGGCSATESKAPCCSTDASPSAQEAQPKACCGSECCAGGEKEKESKEKPCCAADCCSDNKAKETVAEPKDGSSTPTAGCCSDKTEQTTGCCSDGAKQSTGCCFSAGVTKDGDTVASTIDVNELTAPYQIYAIKPSENDSSSAVKVNEEPLSNYWDAYPKPKSTSLFASVEYVADLIRQSHPEQRDFAIVDVRRHDHDGVSVSGSFQRHAQEFYDKMDTFHADFGGKKEVIFYCSSSNGRGPRCAGWYQDYLDTKVQNASSRPKVTVLEGGIKKWLLVFSDTEEASRLIHTVEK